MSEPPADTAEGIARIEGYLLFQAEMRKARQEAEDFADRLPWLTAGQREDVVRHYAQARVAVSQQTLRAVAARCAELRRQYTARYESLRLRLLCVAVAVFLASATLLTTACFLTTRIGG